MLSYQKTVKEITELPWHQLDEEGFLSLMVLSAYNAKEFAESLRIALSLYPKNNNLIQMARGELQTNNLIFEDYKKRGDHADFLWHYIEKYELGSKVDKKIFEIGEKYLAQVQKLSAKLRAHSIFSREDVLTPIFARIIESIPRKTPPMKAYEYYLRRHIYLDSSSGGHRDLTAEFQVTDEVDAFYQIRLKAYESLFRYFGISTKR